MGHYDAAYAADAKRRRDERDKLIREAVGKLEDALDRLGKTKPELAARDHIETAILWLKFGDKL